MGCIFWASEKSIPSRFMNLHSQAFFLKIKTHIKRCWQHKPNDQTYPREDRVLFQNSANLLSNSMQTKDNNWTPHLGKPSMSSIRSLQFAKYWHYSRRRANKLTKLYLRPHLGRTCSISTTDNWNALDFNIRCKSTTIDQIGVRQTNSQKGRNVKNKSWKQKNGYLKSLSEDNNH